MELLEKMLKDETDALVNQIISIKDKTKRDEIIKSFLIDINHFKNSVNQILEDERTTTIDEFIKKDDEIRKTPAKKRDFSQIEREILNKYLKSIKDIQENTEDDNQKLHQLMKSNNIVERTKAREDLINGNMKLAIRFLARIILSYSEVTNLEDLIDEVNVDLIKAVNYYNPEMGSLKNLLFFTIKRSINECLEVGHSPFEVPLELKRVSNEIENGVLTENEIISKNNLNYSTYFELRNALLSTSLDDESTDLKDNLIEYPLDDLILADKAKLKLEIDNMLKTLEFNEEDIIRKRFGINCEKMTIDAIARMYNSTRERIRGVEARALNKMRHPLRNREVRRSM